eukprot:361401-Chlamydomonas_euryale.AAC.1
MRRRVYDGPGTVPYPEGRAARINAREAWRRASIECGCPTLALPHSTRSTRIPIPPWGGSPCMDGVDLFDWAGGRGMDDYPPPTPPHSSRRRRRSAAPPPPDPVPVCAFARRSDPRASLITP